MVVETTRPDETTIVVDIVHGDAQSYSKAVQPRAMKAARQAIVAGQWGLADVDYDQPNPAPHRARTVYRFERQAA
jgi:hypothetical protein